MDEREKEAKHVTSNDKISKLFEARNKAQATIDSITSGELKYFSVKGEEAAVDITDEHHADQHRVVELLDELASTSERRRSPR